MWRRLSRQLDQMHELKAFFLSLNQDKFSGCQADLQAQVAGKGR
jgi:hypothetical protein